MEPKNHPIEKEHIIFQSVSYSNTFSFCNLSKICVTIHPWGVVSRPTIFHGLLRLTPHVGSALSEGQGEGDQALIRRYLESTVEQWKDIPVVGL